MDGKIDNEGYLWILRGKQGKPQDCPFDTSDSARACGDWCPLFGEPEPEYSPEVDDDDGMHEQTGGVLLTLCHKTLVFDTLVDERGK